MFSDPMYPSYLHGGPGYLMSRRTVRKLLAASTSVPVFHMEDVYITGLLAERAAIPRVSNVNFRTDWPACSDTDSATIHHIGPEQMATCQRVGE